MFRISDFHNISESVREKSANVKLVVTDVDGVLTDGSINYLSDGTELKSFYVQDGMGANLLQKEGVKIAVITGRQSMIVSKRCDELKIEEVHQGVSNKDKVLRSILNKLDIKSQFVAYIGDDINDLSALRIVGLKICPSDAHPLVKREVDYITWKRGGKGAFRELADLILMSKDSLNIKNQTTQNQ